MRWSKYIFRFLFLFLKGFLLWINQILPRGSSTKTVHSWKVIKWSKLHLIALQSLSQYFLIDWMLAVVWPNLFIFNPKVCRPSPSINNMFRLLHLSSAALVTTPSLYRPLYFYRFSLLSSWPLSINFAGCSCLLCVAVKMGRKEKVWSVEYLESNITWHIELHPTHLNYK